MYKRRRIISSVSIIVWCLTTSWISAQEREATGFISYLEGDITLYREGTVIYPEYVDIGSELHEFDLIEVAEDSLAEIEITLPSRAGMMIKVMENTVFYFSTGSYTGSNQTRVQLLSGSASMKVRNLFGEVLVKTDTTIMGVRGTDFDVLIAPERSVLLTCSEGRVYCTDETNTKIYAEPGTIVERSSDGGLKAFAVPSDDIALYQEFWKSQREELFKASAFPFVRFYYQKYVTFLPQFLEAYKDLMDQFDLIIGYKDAVSIPLSEGIAVRREAGSAFIEMRRVFPHFEHVFYSVQILGRYHRQGLGAGTIRRRYTTKEFFDEFDEAQEDLKKKLGVVRYLFKLYARIGSLSSDGMGVDDPLSEFFNEMSPF